jgi:hypothetical protein
MLSNVSCLSLSRSWHTDLYYGSYRLPNLEMGLWLVSRGCLLLHGTWSHLWLFRGPCLPYSQICISYKICEIDDCSLFMSFSKVYLKYHRKLYIEETKSIAFISREAILVLSVVVNGSMLSSQNFKSTVRQLISVLDKNIRFYLIRKLTVRH